MDLASLLKAEIAKKKQEIESSESTVEEASKDNGELQRGDEIEDEPEPTLQERPAQSTELQSETDSAKVSIEKSQAESTIPSVEQNKTVSLNSLQSRAARIAKIQAADKEVDHKISAASIGDPEQESHLALQCNLFIHSLLQEWQSEGYKPDLILETKKALYSVLLQLRKKMLPSELITSLATILYHIQQHQFPLATQSYLKLSIGNVAWPIGVTSVGIHARSAHERIQGKDKIANVMLDEPTRLWITSVKRLITFAEALERRKKA